MNDEIRAMDIPRDISLTPEQDLIAAVLHTAMTDAMSQAKVGSPGWYIAQEARAWLKKKAVVMEWLTMAGLPDHVYDDMLAYVAKGKVYRGPWRAL